MPALKTIRLACDVKNTGRLIDEYTGVSPVIIRGDTVDIEIALLQNGALQFVDTVSFRISQPGTTVALLAGSLGAINETLTAAQWRNGSASLATIRLTEDDTAALQVGLCGFKIEGVDAATSATYLSAFLNVVDSSPSIAFTGPASPSTYWTKSESDVRFAFTSDVVAIDDRLIAVELLEPVLYTSQTKTGPEKAQARTNIGAAAATSTLEGFTSGALVFSDYQAWNSAIAADTTLTATGTPGAGIAYSVNLIQDATGGHDITWPSGYIVSPSAIINPKPSTTSAFTIRSRRISSGAFESIVDPFQEFLPNCEPCFRFDLRQRARLTVTSGNLISATDHYSGLVSTTQTATQAFTANGIGGAPAITLTGTAHMWFGSTATPTLVDSTIPAGVTIAAVFTSGTASDTCMAHLGPLGLGLYQRGGNLEFGSASSTGNRCALAFTPNDSTSTLAIFVLHPSSGGVSGYLIKSGDAHKVAYAASGAPGTTTTNYELFQTQGGTARHVGKVAHLALYDRALSWEQVQQLAATLRSDFEL